MKIIVTADLHADLIKAGATNEIAQLGEAIWRERPEVLIVAGDLVGLGKKYIVPTLEKLAPPQTKKLIVPGNHDLWLPEGDAFVYYRDALPEIYAKAGFHMLDQGAVVMNQVAFVGNIGWYDYSFADPNLPPSQERNYEQQRWADVCSWNDFVFVKRAMSDQQFCSWLLERLRQQLLSLPAAVTTVVAVTHTVAFAEMVMPNLKKPAENFFNAFQGSRRIGELLLSDPRVKYHFCGHTHSSLRLQKGHLLSVNVGSTYDKKRLEILEV